MSRAMDFLRYALQGKFDLLEMMVTNMADRATVAAIGGANVDIFGRSFDSLCNRDSNPGRIFTSPGGVARNVAENLARLGVHCHLVTAIGDDQNGEMLLAQCSAVGINVQGVQRIASLPTSTCLTVLDEAGDMHIAISDMRIMEALNAERLARLQSLIAGSSLIILDANLPDDALEWLMGTFSGLTIFADAVSTAKATRLRPYLDRIHSLKTGAIEAEALSGLGAQTDGEVQKMAEWFHGHGVGRLFVTRGDHGVFYSTDRTRAVTAPRHNIPEIENTSGAGDAFLAGLAHAWLQRLSIRQSVDVAIAAASITIQSHKTCSPALSVAAIEKIISRESTDAG